MSKLISTRVPREVEADITKLAREKHTGKTLVLREVIIKGLAGLKLEYALDLYKKGKVTLWKAAQLSDVSLWEMMEIVKERKIPAQYGEKELKEDLKALRE